MCRGPAGGAAGGAEGTDKSLRWRPAGGGEERVKSFFSESLLKEK